MSVAKQYVCAPSRMHPCKPSTTNAPFPNGIRSTVACRRKICFSILQRTTPSTSTASNYTVNPNQSLAIAILAEFTPLPPPDDKASHSGRALGVRCYRKKSDEPLEQRWKAGQACRGMYGRRTNSRTVAETSERDRYNYARRAALESSQLDPQVHPDACPSSHLLDAIQEQTGAERRRLGTKLRSWPTTTGRRR